MDWGLFLKSGISLDRLQNFCRVAEVESFTVAAEGDSNRQTLYSRQVKELEQFFEVELFLRKGRTVILSPHGKQLYSLLCEYFSALEDFKESCSGDLGSYVIGAGDSVIQWSLLPRLNKLQACMGKADLTFKNLRSTEIIDGVEKGTIDFGIVRSDAVTSRLASREVGALQFSLFHPIVESAEGLNEAALLSHFSFAGMESGGSYQEHLDQLVASHGIMMKTSVSCSSFPMMAKAVRILKMAAILPNIAVEELPASEFRKVDLTGLEPLGRDLAICWNQRLAKMDPHLFHLGEEISELLKGD
jgi:DNA-binding transcriptional LysR family regulator